MNRLVVSVTFPNAEKTGDCMGDALRGAREKKIIVEKNRKCLAVQIREVRQYIVEKKIIVDTCIYILIMNLLTTRKPSISSTTTSSS